MLKVEGNEIEIHGDTKELLTDYTMLTAYVLEAISQDKSIGKSGARHLMLKAIFYILKRG